MHLEEFAKKIEQLRLVALFGGTDPLTADDADAVGTDGLDMLAELEYLAALGHLELAHCCARKADLLQARALATSPYRQ